MKTWVEERIEEYNEGSRTLEKYRDKLLGGKKIDNIEDETLKLEIEIVAGMIADMHFAIDWMRNGRRPGQRRGIDQHDAYKRAALMDMDIFPSIDFEHQESSITDAQRKHIVKILIGMTKRERQCYLLHMAHGLSMAEIGKELMLSKRTVQQYVERAKLKVTEETGSV